MNIPSLKKVENGSKIFSSKMAFPVEDFVHIRVVVTFDGI